PGDAVNLVDEQHVVLDEVGRLRRQVPGPPQRRTRRPPQRRSQFGGDDHRQRRLAQPRRARQQDVIRCAAAVFGPLENKLQLSTPSRLADELPQRARPQAGVDVTLADGQGSRDLPVLVVFPVRGTHFVFPSIDSAERSADDVVASASAASTLSVASSACLAAKPSPTRASTTGPRMLWPFNDGDTPPVPTGPILSRNSSTSRSALRLPMPGTRVRAFTSPSASACRSALASEPASLAKAIFGPMPETPSSVRNRSRASPSGNP